MKQTTEFLKAMADENRMKMLDLLQSGPMCVSDIGKHFDMKQPSISHHLTVLKQAGIVKSYKCGKEQRYSLNYEVLNEKFDDLNFRFCEQGDAYLEMFKRLNEEPDKFKEGSFGIEKESLRINDKGCIDQSDHPVPRDSIYYKNIVKDFAECQVEFVTNPFESPKRAMDQLVELQQHFVERNDVRLWPFSMPACVKGDFDIRIAEYDDSPEGKAARAYREMLAERHGKKMQLISGIHYNFSFSETMAEVYRSIYLKEGDYELQQIKDRMYFHVARNLLRHKWLMIYLTGASPFVDGSYKEEVIAQLKGIEYDCHCCSKAHTYYEDYATSLRMSRYGYHNKLQEEMRVSYNALEEYVAHMRNGIDQGILQKESEYYAPLRFKNSHGMKGSMLDALEREGVEYLELRMFDLNPYEPYGISLDTMYLTHLFLIYSLMKPSPHISAEEMNDIYANGQMISLFGRKPDIQVFFRGASRDICELGCVILTDLEKIAAILDRNEVSGPYIKAVQEAKRLLNNKDELPSARVIKELMDDNMSYVHLGLRYSVHKAEKVSGVSVE